MTNMPKVLMAAGAMLFIAGLVWALIGKAVPIGRLPGDIVIEKENVRFYFPIVTCLLISVVLSLILYVVRLFLK